MFVDFKVLLHECLDVLEGLLDFEEDFALVAVVNVVGDVLLCENVVFVSNVVHHVASCCTGDYVALYTVAVAQSYDFDSAVGD
jgi:hypothetical protein